jgi:predicted secreted Zn-dependent protease
MPAEGKSRTGCIVAAVLGCALALGVLFVAGAGAALFYFRARATTSRPVVTALPTVEEPSESEAPGPSDPNLQIEQKIQHYAIAGSSASELRRQMNQLGPSDASGRHDAFTRWYVRWSYPYDRSPGSCGLGKVKVSVTVSYTLPEWSDPAAAPPDLVTQWNGYLAAVRRHEDGHRDNGVAAGRDVLAKLRAFGTRDTCDAANRDANAAGNRILDEYRTKDRRYDETTRHGATQGAKFPL